MFWSEIQEPWSDLGCVKYRLPYPHLEDIYIRLLIYIIGSFFLNSRTLADLETKIGVWDFFLVEFIVDCLLNAVACDSSEFVYS